MEHHHHHQHVSTTGEAADRDRLPQWSHAETAELLSIRAELDRAFMETKRNKPLWESVASRMQLKGHHRTPDQCKSKWKNLVTRFKGTSDFPFRQEMQKIYDDRKRAQHSDEEEEEKRRGGEGEVLEGFLREAARRQREMEERWAEEDEAREAERRSAEEEWRRAMEALWEEREALERRWREREEERRARAEERTERRHALITAILTRLARDGG